MNVSLPFDITVDMSIDEAEALLNAIEWLKSDNKRSDTLSRHQYLLVKKFLELLRTKTENF